MKKTLLVLTLVSALPIAPLQAEWRDYVPSVPFWNSTASEDKENVVLSEKEQLIQSAKKYVYAGAALLALYVVLTKTPIYDLLKYMADHSGIFEREYGQYGRRKHPLLKALYWEFIDTLKTIARPSKVAGLACFGKAGYDLFKAPFAQSAVSENKENVVLTEKEQLIESAKKYAGIGAALLALYIVNKTSISDTLYWEFIDTLKTIARSSKVASLACFGKAGYDLFKTQFAQSDNTQETINS